jgi:hypothetical protein
LDKHIFPWQTFFLKGLSEIVSSSIQVIIIYSTDQSFSTTSARRVGWLFVKLFEKYTKVQTVHYEYFQYLAIHMYVSCMTVVHEERKAEKQWSRYLELC